MKNKSMLVTAVNVLTVLLLAFPFALINEIEAHNRHEDADYNIFVTCIEKNFNGTFTAFFGYENKESLQLELDSSEFNPSSTIGNPPIVLKKGKLEKEVIGTTEIANAIVWKTKIGHKTKTATVTQNSNECSKPEIPAPIPVPVPQPDPSPIPPTDPSPIPDKEIILEKIEINENGEETENSKVKVKVFFKDNFFEDVKEYRILKCENEDQCKRSIKYINSDEPQKIRPNDFVEWGEWKDFEFNKDYEVEFSVIELYYPNEEGIKTLCFEFKTKKEKIIEYKCDSINLKKESQQIPEIPSSVPEDIPPITIPPKPPQNSQGGSKVSGISTAQTQLSCKTSPYLLPYPGGTTIQCGQGRQNGEEGGSHVPGDTFNQWAYDFWMPNGGEVSASADGTVQAIQMQYKDGSPTEPIEGANGGCSPAFANTANYVRITHSNGQTTYYLHLMQYSSELRVGDPVRSGQVIGKVGFTGYTCGYHLHFTAGNSNFSAGVASEFADASVCNDTHLGVPDYPHSFKSDNYFSGLALISPSRNKEIPITQASSVNFSWHPIKDYVGTYQLIINGQIAFTGNATNFTANLNSLLFNIPPNTPTEWYVKSQKVDPLDPTKKIESPKWKFTLNFNTPSIVNPTNLTPIPNYKFRIESSEVIGRGGATQYKFELFKKTNPNTITTRSFSTNKYFDATVNSGGEYMVRVQAKSGNDLTEWSEWQEFFVSYPEVVSKTFKPLVGPNAGIEKVFQTYRGSDANSNKFYTRLSSDAEFDLSSNEETWSISSGINIDSNVQMEVFGGKLYQFVRTTVQNEIKYRSTTDGINFTAWSNVSPGLSLGTLVGDVTLVTFNSKLYLMAHNNEGKIYMASSSDGTFNLNPSNEAFVFQAVGRTDGDVTSYVYNNKLYQVVRGSGVDKNLLYMRYTVDGAFNTPGSQDFLQMTGGTGGDFATAFFKNRLYQLVRDSSNSGEIWSRYSSDEAFDNNLLQQPWEVWAKEFEGRAGSDITTATVGNKLIMTLRGREDGEIYTRTTLDGDFDKLDKSQINNDNLELGSLENWSQQPGTSKARIDMISFGGKLYQFVIGGSIGDEYIYYRTSVDAKYDSPNETFIKLDSNVKFKSKLSLIEYKGKLLLTGIGLDGIVRIADITNATGTNALNPTWYLQGGGLGEVYSTIFNDRLFQSLKGSDGYVYFRSSDDGNFSDQDESKENLTSTVYLSKHSPSIYSYFGKLYMIVVGNDNLAYLGEYNATNNSWINWNTIGGSIGDVKTVVSDSALLQSLIGTDGLMYSRAIIEGNAGNFAPSLNSNTMPSLINFDGGIFQTIVKSDATVNIRSVPNAESNWINDPVNGKPNFNFGNWSINGTSADEVTSTVHDQMLCQALRTSSTTANIWTRCSRDSVFDGNYQIAEYDTSLFESWHRSRTFEKWERQSGIVAVSDPVNVEFGGRFYQFVKGTDGFGYYRYSTEGYLFDYIEPGETWTKLENTVASGKISTINFNNRFIQSVVGSDNKLWTRYGDSNNPDLNSITRPAKGWDVNDSTNFNVIGEPSFEIINGNLLIQSIRDSSNVVRSRTSNNGITWSNWSANGASSSDITMISFKPTGSLNDYVYQFIRGYDGLAYYRRSLDGLNWGSGWTSLGKTLTQKPTTSVFNGRLYLFLVENSANVFTLSTADGVFNNSESLENPVKLDSTGSDSPIFVESANTRMYMSVKNSSGQIYTRSSDDGDWNDFNNPNEVSERWIYSGATVGDVDFLYFKGWMHQGVRGLEITSFNTWIRSSKDGIFDEVDTILD